MKNNKGFTIIELLVTIAVLAILISLAVPKYISHVEAVNKEQMLSDFQDVKQQKESVLSQKEREEKGEKKRVKTEDLIRR